MLASVHNILFRADSSSTIGTGHIMRDLVLAEQFEDANIVFATQDLPGNVNHKIKEKNYTIEILNSNDIGELTDIIKKYSIEMIVIDHYDINEAFEKKLKKETSAKLFVLDDTYEQHYCDILLNHNIYSDATQYNRLVPESCELRCGEKYTLLRDEFIDAKQIEKISNATKQKTLFVAMGGSDVANLNPKILRVIERFENVQVNVVTTTANSNLEELQEFVEHKSWVNLHIDSTEIAKLMAKSDLAIVTPSVTMNEIWYMQIPFVAIKVADNQFYMYQFLKEKKMNVLESFNENILERYFEKFLGA